MKERDEIQEESAALPLDVSFGTYGTAQILLGDETSINSPRPPEEDDDERLEKLAQASQKVHGWRYAGEGRVSRLDFSVPDYQAIRALAVDNILNRVLGGKISPLQDSFSLAESGAGDFQAASNVDLESFSGEPTSEVRSGDVGESDPNGISDGLFVREPMSILELLRFRTGCAVPSPLRRVFLRRDDVPLSILYSDYKRHTVDRKKHVLLGELRATAIAGNDITSSCLYTAGIAGASGGKYAPISLLLVVFVLRLFRGVYAEVGGALPLNGGSYTALLNSTSKAVASVGACLTLLSYCATCVVSASDAMAYAQAGLWNDLPVFWFTILVLLFFALLNLFGISESATVALLIFVLHIYCLGVLTVFAIIFTVKDHGKLLMSNFHSGTVHSHWIKDIFFGYCAGMLGVTGFETSANYIEEQRPGVFPKTLRNMWLVVGVFNPLLGLLQQGVLDISRIRDSPESVLAMIAEEAGGSWLKILICSDATLVLCGAVLTSYVGVTGLVRRMAFDRTLPQFFLKKNPITRTEYRIICSFFLITASLYVLVHGDVQRLARVYAVSFLAVMSLFAIGNMLLKYKRSELPRTSHAWWITCVMALCFVLAGLFGTILDYPRVIPYFLLYFCATILVVQIMFQRVKVLKFFVALIRSSPLEYFFGQLLRKQVRRINSQPIVFFMKTDNPYQMNKGVQYIRDNELTDNVRIVNFYELEPPPNMMMHAKFLDVMYPYMRIDLILVKGRFCPENVARFSSMFEIPANYCFISCPGSKFPDTIGAYGGLRVVTH